MSLLLLLACLIQAREVHRLLKRTERNGRDDRASHQQVSASSEPGCKRGRKILPSTISQVRTHFDIPNEVGAENAPQAMKVRAGRMKQQLGRQMKGE